MTPEAWPQEIVVHPQFIRFLARETAEDIFDALIGQNHVRNFANERSAAAVAISERVGYSKNGKTASSTLSPCSPC